VLEVLEQLDEYFAAIEALGFRDFVEFDMKIVRGLAYYTGIVFELFDRRGELRAICGGGRYDTLFTALAGVDVPALGFGMGDVVQGELLKDRKLAAEGTAGVDVVVIPVDEASRPEVLRVVSELRRAGKSTHFPYKQTGVGKALKAAAATGARHAIVIGPDEVSGKKIKLKNLESGAEAVTTLQEFIDGRTEV
jgi:histidyl-tRNA synthetase